jgi:hypothetical protein
MIRREKEMSTSLTNRDNFLVLMTTEKPTSLVALGTRLLLP